MKGTLTELWGLPGSGKTHLAIDGWPDPLLVDTAFTSLGFREHDIDADPDERGESWAILLKLCDYDQEKAAERYHYLSGWPEDLSFCEGFDSVIIDNAADLRVIAVHEWVQNNDYDWPQQAQWGQINDMIDGLLRTLQRDYHTVVISQMKDEYKNDVKTGKKEREGPKRMDHKADLRFELRVGDDGRKIHVRKNRWLDPASDDYMSEGTVVDDSLTFEEVMYASEQPEELWRRE